MEVNNSKQYLPSQNIIHEAYKRFKKKIGYVYIVKRLDKHCHDYNLLNNSILEVGCGAGYFQEAISDRFNLNVAGDSDINLLKVASNRSGRYYLLNFDGQYSPFKDNIFNIVIALQVIEHMKDPFKFINDAHRILKKDGLLIFSTPNPTGLAARILKDKWQGIKKDHVSLKSPDNWRRMLNSKFEILKNGTTGLTGFKILRLFPFSLLNYVPMLFFGILPWQKGESFLIIAKKV